MGDSRKMLSVAKNPSEAIKYMEQGKNFFVVYDKSDKYEFYQKVGASLEIHDEDGKPVEYIQRSLNVSFDINRFLAQLGSMLALSTKNVLKFSSKIIGKYKDDQLDKIVDLSKDYKITIQYDKRILFEYVGKGIQ